MGLVSPETQQALDKRLEEYEKKTGTTVAVWIGSTTGDAALETWAQSAINAWKVREKKYADGVVMFILTKDRAIDVEVAAGFEKQLPDTFVGQMIMEQMGPRLEKNDANGALTAGVEAILARLSNPQKPAPTKAPAKTTEKPAPAASAAPEPANEDAPKTTEEPTLTFRTPSVWLLMALGTLIILSTVSLAVIGWPRDTKKRS